jgi:SprT-like family
VQLSLLFDQLFGAGQDVPPAEFRVPSGPRTTQHAAPGTRNGASTDQLIARLRALGLPPFAQITTHRNQQVMLSWVPGRVLRVHEGYAAAPDRVLEAIVRFVTPGVRRPARLAARRTFLSFPAEDHAPRPSRPARPRRIPPADVPLLARLEQLRTELNLRHFDGRLGAIPIRLSDRMRRRLGELRLERKTGQALHIGISRRHVRRDGWAAVTDTLLHEMVHQWQAETGRSVDHGREFRAKAREVGIEPRAVRRDW